MRSGVRSGVDERRECEFFLVRYVPDAVKNEFVNIGVLLRPTGEPGGMTVRFTRDWSRVRCVDPDADVAMLEALEGEIQRRLEHPDHQPVMKVLEDSFSNAVQLTEAKGCLAESLGAEMEALMRLYVEARKREAAPRRSARMAIHSTMRSEFERAGVWSLMRKRIAAEEYTRPGDPLRIDCGYRPNGVIRMFQAVTLEGDLEMAKVLAYSAPALQQGVVRVEKASLELTAVVEPIAKMAGDEERVTAYRFAVETMEEREIRVVTTKDLTRLAEAARAELSV